MKILIFGAGAIGSVLGGFLARMGHDVSLLGRARHLDVIEKNGLIISGIWGDYRMKAFELYRESGEIRANGATFDLIILTTKSFDTVQAADEILPLMNEKTMLVSCQDGVASIDVIKSKIRPEQFLVGVPQFAVSIESGHAKVVRNDGEMMIGSLPGVTPLSSPHAIAQMLNLAKIPAKVVPNILEFVPKEGDRNRERIDK